MSVQAYEGKRGLRWVRAGSCLVTYIEADKLVDDALWATWLSVLEEAQVKTALVCGWGPIQASTAQWRQFTNVIKAQELPVVVIADARHNAALAKKAAWIGANIKFFKWDSSLYEPFAHLGFDLTTRKSLKPKVFALRDCHGPVDGSAGPAEGSASPARAKPEPAPRREPAPKREMPAWMREKSTKRPSAVLSSIEQTRAPRPSSTRPTSPTRPASSIVSTADKPKSGLAEDIRRSRDTVFQSSSDIQAKLAEVQARLRARNLEMRRRREG